MTNTFPDPGLYTPYWKSCFILCLSFRKCDSPPILLGTRGHGDVALKHCPQKTSVEQLCEGQGDFPITLMASLLNHT